MAALARRRLTGDSLKVRRAVALFEEGGSSSVGRRRLSQPPVILGLQPRSVSTMLLASLDARGRRQISAAWASSPARCSGSRRRRAEAAEDCHGGSTGLRARSRSAGRHDGACARACLCAARPRQGFRTHEPRTSKAPKSPTPTRRATACRFVIGPSASGLNGRNSFGLSPASIAVSDRLTTSNGSSVARPYRMSDVLRRSRSAAGRSGNQTARRMTGSQRSPRSAGRSGRPRP